MDMRPLHIEKNFMEAIGNWLEGSGWTELYVHSKITTPGKPDTFFTCSGKSGIKRSRYAHQVTLSALITLAKEAFNEQSEFDDFNGNLIWRPNRLLLNFGFRR